MLLPRLHRHEMDHTDCFDVFSEEFTPFVPGSFLYCDPSQVETWTQSVPFGDTQLPTPPDSGSECDSLDSQDMSSQTWSQASQPEEWTPTSAQEYSTYLQPSAGGWTSNGMPVTVQDVQAFDNAAWLNVSSGPVDQGLSPVLSQKSQSTHTLNSFSESDACILSHGLDLSFTAEPSWNPSAPMVYSTAPSAFPSTEQGFAQSYEHAGKANGLTPCPQGYYPGVAPVFYPQGGQVQYAPRPAYPALAPKRQLLPRTEGPPQTVQSSHGQHRVLRPFLQGQRESQASFSSVSSTAGQPHEGPQHNVVQVGLSVTSPAPAQAAPSAVHGMHHSQVIAQPIASSQACAPAPFMVDPTAQDFSDFIHFDQEEHTASPAHTSYAQGYDMHLAQPHVSMESKMVISQPEQDVNAMYQGSSSETASLANESEEGRHRNHPLYAAEPHADGLFHCPYKAKDPNCPHKPTKLKCNYDKYIDSHLKPFRCKIDTCAKQEFSSTACLLRHEREAHGMHGHGDRPHLCYYTGCDRGIPGNGFPRRYNLFDHMKRVHDHKEDPRAGTRSPSVPNNQEKKGAAGRKRKALEPAPLESAAQRPRTTIASAQPSQVIVPAQVYSVQPQDCYQQAVFAEPAARRNQAQSHVYHHWANQRHLIERQMGSLQSPDDEAGLERMSQNFEQFRRLSAAVRRG